LVFASLHRGRYFFLALRQVAAGRPQKIENAAFSSIRKAIRKALSKLSVCHEQKTVTHGGAWHYLGLALLVTGNKDEAQKAFERAATIRLNDLITISPLPLLKNPAPGSEGVKPRDRYQVAFESVEQLSWR